MYDNKITLGNIIQIVVLIFALIMAYAKLNSNQEYLEKQVNEQKSLTQKLATDTAEKVNTVNLESNYVRSETYKLQMQYISDRLMEIKDELKEIKKEVKR